MIRPDLTSPSARASALARHQIKDIENRKWSTKFRGPVLVHAALTLKPNDYEVARKLAATLGVTLPMPADLQRGGIIGQFTITDCISESPSPWFFGRYGFVVANATPLPFQPCRGMLSFFTPKV